MRQRECQVFCLSLYASAQVLTIWTLNRNIRGEAKVKFVLLSERHE
jgi:hypothetical protein